jgi:hypothetical protein
MTIAYNWKITDTDRNLPSGYVFCAHWRATAVDGEHSASVYSTCSWADGEVTIPYEDLTEQDVLDWVWVSVDKDATEQALADQIEMQKHPVTASGMPWSV